VDPLRGQFCLREEAHGWTELDQLDELALVVRGGENDPRCVTVDALGETASEIKPLSAPRSMSTRATSGRNSRTLRSASALDVAHPTTATP